MKNIRNILLLTIVCVMPTMLSANATESESLFARVATDGNDEPTALQLAIVTYVPESGEGGYSVDLVSAIHIGEKEYYATLNDKFTDYDTLLYELVAPQGTIVTRDTERKGFISNAQMTMTRLLDLTFQLDEIDYTATNFVHADLSGDELSQSMADRNESLYTYFWRVFFASMREYGKDPLGLRDWQMLSAILRDDDDGALKTMLAYELVDLDTIQDVLGEDSDSAVIGARNERAIEVLHTVLDSGASRIGIFYGVGHMPDLEERLLRMGLVPARTVWVDAWYLGQQ